MAIPRAPAWAWDCPAPKDCRTSSTSNRRPAREHGLCSRAGASSMLVAVSDQSQVAAARRAAATLARELGFDEEKAGRVAIVATEMAGNISKHGGDGHLIVDRFADSEG